MAQLVAHLHGMERVRGSNPLSSTDRVSGDFRTPFFHTQIRNPNQHPNSSSHWRKPDAARHLTVQKSPPSGGILPPTSLPASQNLQSLEKTRRNQTSHSPDSPSHWNTRPAEAPSRVRIIPAHGRITPLKDHCKRPSQAGLASPLETSLNY